MPSLSSVANHLANAAWALAPGSRSSLRGRDVRLVAHRGAHGPGAATENTLAAFQLCADAGAWAVETDIHLTRDGEPVIHHDPGCGRLFNRPELMIASTDFATLRAAIPEILHLQEVVERFAGSLHLMLEVKESWRQRPEYPARVAAALKDLEPERDYHLLSLEPDHLEGFRNIPRSAFVDVAWMNAGAIIRQNLALGHGGVAGSFALLGSRRLAQLRAAGRKIGTGFVENAGALRREVHRGADWIFTDRIMAMQELVNRDR
ncbi:glycerophosphodiester phosphodiesterase [Haliea sp. E1-2-M8]|uniref:glycerophosphodiester phosphodiesterase n=1 Tax=Haliea sp. E1-2-M8 TaxID=3064706 RepID=UPI00271AFEBE|nr:glycerophosphodiester phosphodiesterase [Haliea sp. E1-2-M8]MDO8863739.1 glycerophosphodiester phosphodiesterase [Haliea sp. E1-2-M8]